ncbi:MAG: peptidylprolyl isomerase [Trichloromonas sp.]|jgi:parvulin-like peptidyl-prolyl isomerase|nr:peptidylprolyl isomerase [Trichloromonas sp.]
MRLFSPRALTLAVILSALFGASSACAAARILAEVGGVPITAQELRREQQRLIPMQVAFHAGVSPEKLAQIEEQAYAKLIKQAFKVRYALDEELRVDGAVVEEQFNQLRARFKTQKELLAALGEEGADGYKASLYRQLLAAEAERVAVDQRVGVTDEQVRAYYDERRATYKRPRQFKASQILVKVDPASNKEEREALLAKAQGLLAQARAGEDFYNLAYYNSDDRSKYVGGDLGYFHEGQTVKEFEDALKQLKPGEISEPIRTMYGYHIVKLFENNDPRQLDFEEVQDKIRKTLEKEARDKIYEEWMSSLRERYPVKKFTP